MKSLSDSKSQLKLKEKVLKESVENFQKPDPAFSLVCGGQKQETKQNVLYEKITWWLWVLFPNSDMCTFS